MSQRPSSASPDSLERYTAPREQVERDTRAAPREAAGRTRAWPLRGMWTPGRLALAVWWNLALPVLIFVVTWVPRQALARTLDLVTDESVYIPTGLADMQLLLYGRLENPYWLVNFEAPSLPKLFMGLGAFYGYQHDGPQGWLYGARLPGVLLMALTLIAVYALARPIFGKVGAALGALTLALSPWVAFFNSIAYLDTYLLCFMTVAGLLTWHAARRPWLWPVVGLFIGLAFDSKYTAAFVLAPMCLYLAFYYLCVARRLPPWQMALGAVVTVLSVYVFDPAIWVNPIPRLWGSILFQYNHASNGHDAFWNGAVWQHVPPGIGMYILLAKMSLFVVIPAALGAIWAATTLVQTLHSGRPVAVEGDISAFIFAWLLGLVVPFGALNIIVGAHYVLPIAPPVALTAGWAYARLAEWAAIRATPWVRRGLSALAQRLPSGVATRREVSARVASSLAGALMLAVIVTAMLAPHAIGLATTPYAEGYTSEWLAGENGSLQVAYPAYADAVRWITAHSTGRTTVTLVMGETGALDYWMSMRQSLFPQRIRLAVGTPDNFPHSEYIVWPEHLVQRQFPKPSNFNSLIVKRIQGGSTTYCYILRWPHPDR